VGGGKKKILAGRGEKKEGKGRSKEVRSSRPNSRNIQAISLFFCLVRSPLKVKDKRKRGGREEGKKAISSKKEGGKEEGERKEREYFFAMLAIG